MDNFPRDNNRFEVAPCAEATSNIDFVTDLVTENLKSRHPGTRAEKTIELLSKLEPDDIEIWSDGSATEGTRKGGGAATVTTKLQSSVLKASAGELCSSFQAEMTAIDIALKYTKQLGPEHGNSIRLMTDSISAIEKIAAGPQAQDTKTGAKIWNTLNTKERKIIFVWVSSHCGVSCNERADK